MDKVLKIILDGEIQHAIESPRRDHYFIFGPDGVKHSEISLKGIREDKTAICGGHKYRLLNTYMRTAGGDVYIKTDQKIKYRA